MSPRTRTPLPPVAEVLRLHLEEAGFLWERRWQLPAAPGHGWDEAAEIEERLETHLDALVLAGSPGFDLVAERLAADDEPGQAFAAAVVALRLPRLGPREAVADALAAQAPQAEALVDALRWVTHPDAEAWVAALLDDARPAVRRATARACTLRPARLQRIAELASDPDPAVALEAQRTLAFLAPGGAEGAERLDPATAPAPALAIEVLLRRGQPATAVAFCQALAEDAAPPLQAFALDVLAIAGPPGASAEIAARVASRRVPAARGWVALGLSGEAAALGAMLARVDAPWAPEHWPELEPLFQAASLVTGAPLQPAIALDEARPDDLTALRARARDAWGPLLARAQAGRRYRRGEELSAAVLARDLAGPAHPRRDLCALELQARFRCPLPFEPRAPHAVQREAARAIAAWATSAPSESP